MLKILWLYFLWTQCSPLIYTTAANYYWRIAVRRPLIGSVTVTKGHHRTAKVRNKTREATQRKGVKNDGSARLRIYLCPRLTFDLLTPKVDRFMPLPHGPLVPISIKSCSVVFKIKCSQVW